MLALSEFLAEAVARGASDIHLKPGAPPTYRVKAALQTADRAPLTENELRALADAAVPEHLRADFARDHEADFSIHDATHGRFRVNAFVCGGECNLTLRHVKSRIPTFEELRLPPILRRIAQAQRGIILAAGTTGSGKSTTLAAIINHINTHERRRIITIEDPVEYLFADAQSIISQREVGPDTASFHAALKRVLRQDPDVIMIGEMRDAESFLAALAAAETGHLVLSTLHAGNAAQAVPRILDLFPASERDGLRMALADTLRAVFCQRLVPATDGNVRPAVEILINTPTVRKLLEKNALEKLPAAIETGTEDGMQTFNQAVFRLIKSGEITEEQGLRHCGNPDALRMNLKGIFLDESRRILAT